MAEQIHTLNQEIRDDKVFSSRPYGGISGRGKGKIVFVMKQPSYHEAKSGIAFSDESGQFMIQHMKRKGWQQDDLYCTYALKVFAQTSRRPTKQMVDDSLFYLQEELELIKPKLIVPLGAEVMRIFGVKGSINKNMGQVFPGEYGPVMPLADPFSFNKAGKGREVPKFVTGLDRIRTYLEGETPAPEHDGGAVDVSGHYGIDVEVEDFEDDSKAWLYSVGYADDKYRMATAVLEQPLVVPLGGIPVMHNAKYDIKWLEQGGMQIDKFEDTMLQAHLLGHSPLALKSLMAIHLGGEPDTFRDVVGTGKKRKRYDDIPEFLDYNSKDAWGTMALFRKYSADIEARGLDTIYKKEKKVLRVLLEMEKRGMPLSQPDLKEWRKVQVKRKGKAEVKLAALDLSPSDLDALRQKFWRGKRNVVLTKGDSHGKNKKMSLSKIDLLERAEEGDEWIHDLIEWKEAEKFINTYLDNWMGQERLHPNFKQTGTQTWRFSCTNPNLQNVTKRGGSRLPYMFAAPEGYTFVSADASQGELREMGNITYKITGDNAIRDSYAKGIDMHSLSEQIEAVQRVAELKGQPVRTVAKSFNFKILFGGTGYGMAEEYDIPKPMGEEMIEGFYRKFPAIRDVHSQWAVDALRDGYVKTLADRPLYIPQMVASEGQFFNRAERQAKNFPVQGGLMEVIKDAMLKFPDMLVMQVHDELLWLVPNNLLKDFLVELEEGLNSDPYDCIPYLWDIHTGSNWGEAKG